MHGGVIGGVGIFSSCWPCGGCSWNENAWLGGYNVFMNVARCAECRVPSAVRA